MRSILIEWPSKFDEIILNDLLSFKQRIQKKLFNEIIYVNSAYNSILVCYKNYNHDFNIRVKVLKTIYNLKRLKYPKQQRLWKIPVCYDLKFGIDLKALSISKNIDANEIIDLHSNAIYTVYFTGFLPGFLYLGGLPETLNNPRKTTPRLKVPKGAVAIGGNQTGIYPEECPGGWHIIGNSPVNLFDVNKKTPSFIRSGDKIKFVNVPLEKHKSILVLVENNIYQLENEVLDD